MLWSAAPKILPQVLWKTFVTKSYANRNPAWSSHSIHCCSHCRTAVTAGLTRIQDQQLKLFAMTWKPIPPKNLTDTKSHQTLCTLLVGDHATTMHSQPATTHWQCKKTYSWTGNILQLTQSKKEQCIWLFSGTVMPHTTEVLGKRSAGNTPAQTQSNSPASAHRGQCCAAARPAMFTRPNCLKRQNDEKQKHHEHTML